VVVEVVGFPVRRSADTAAHSYGRAATVVRVGGAAAAGVGRHSGRAAPRSGGPRGSRTRFAAAAPRVAAIGGGGPAAMIQPRRARPARRPLPLAHQRRVPAW